MYIFILSFIHVVICASWCFCIFMNNAKSNKLWILVSTRGHEGIDSSVLPLPASPGERFSISIRYINVCLLLFTLHTMSFSHFSLSLTQKKKIPVFLSASSFSFIFPF